MCVHHTNQQQLTISTKRKYIEKNVRVYLPMQHIDDHDEIFDNFYHGSTLYMITIKHVRNVVIGQLFGIYDRMFTSFAIKPNIITYVSLYPIRETDSFVPKRQMISYIFKYSS